MAITEQQVIKAAERIAERGERPTNPRIRAELGEGSYSTINKYMAAWRASQQEPEAPKPEPEAPKEPEVPETITAQAHKLAEQLVTAAWRESDAKHAEAIEAERHALQAEFDKLKAERQRHDAEIEDLELALERLEQQGEEAVAHEQAKAEEVRRELAEVWQQHASTREELAAVKAREQAAQERLNELRDEVEVARRQTAEVEQRMRDEQAKTDKHVRSIGDEMGRVMASLEQYKEQAKAAKAAQEEAEKRHTAELEEWRQEVDTAEKALATSDATQRAATDAVTQLKERVEGLEARLVDAHGVIERLTARDKSVHQAEEQPNLPFDGDSKN
ncbi:hypothetical protein HLB35_16245 [Halomonas sp. TBZ9]|uniref:KfrA N-terminal DNA-binding domain-containing protein n=1 Tax=Vreelandella azerica TaxID=2732867 RepID=A0A7Y3TZ92_9GAMM|nr:DNA-binding protein [Halomonas azerica]NOG32933.1 hypothetical protein [Halomonas azerica]